MSAIFVDPEATGAQVIQAYGACYRRVGPSPALPDTFSNDITGEFAGCEECGSSSSGSSGSSARDCSDCEWGSFGSGDTETVDPSGPGPWPVAWFKGGEPIPAGCYRIIYLDGAYDSWAGNLWATDADAVWNDGASVLNFVGGCYFYDTKAEAEACAAGRFLIIEHGGGKIGVKANASGAAIGSAGARCRLQRCVG